MSKKQEFAICVANEGYDDLEIWKVYRVLADPKATGVGCLRVIDESGEDYLYPADRFAKVDIPTVVRARLPQMATKPRPQVAASGYSTQASAERLIVTAPESSFPQSALTTTH